jgi:hypothetical protein
MKLTTSAAVALLLFFTPQLIASNGEKPASVDVCAVIRNPDAFANKVVTVNGIASSSEEELILLCENIPKRRVWLNFPDEQVVRTDATLTGKSLTFHRSKISDTFVSNLLDRCAERKFNAALRGYFQYKKSLTETSADGFGHLGAYQYRLVITDVVAVSGEPCKDYPVL